MDRGEGTFKENMAEHFLTKSLWFQVTETDLNNQERYWLPLLDIQK